jgi:mannose-6-phosphate isomerase-like protein (cupin superfamily)
MTASRSAIALATVWLGLAPHLAMAQAAPAQVHRDAVFIEKGDVDKALAARVNGRGMGALGAVRAGDDRINVDVLRRDTPDEAPVTHSLVTEVYTIIDGGGDFETGGALADPRPMMTNGKPTNPASIGPSMKGPRIIGGATRHVGAGDVVMIPPGVPHGFVKLDGHVTYMVVRVNPGYEKGQ